MNLSPRYFAYAAWITSIISAASSLYFSEVLNFAPCILCWYQRILMYPLTIILAVGILKKDKFLHWYVLPLSILGILISLYQNLLYYKLMIGEILPCSTASPCSAKFLHLLGFLDIPQLSFLGFTFITLCMLMFRKR